MDPPHQFAPSSTWAGCIMQKPVFFDSIEIRQVIEDISVSRDAILFVASRLSSSQEASKDEDNNQKEKSRPGE